MDGGDLVETGVADSDGYWPEEPALMSYASLKEIEECPRRWALRRARYPALWRRSGYPPSVHLAALCGDIVHDTLEQLVGALVSNGCASVRTEDAFGVLKALGGYSAVIGEMMEARLNVLTDNPRVVAQLPMVRTSLVNRIPLMRGQVQDLLSRTEIFPAAGSGTVPRSQDRGERTDLSVGSHAEVALRSIGLGWTGRVDLLTVTASGCEIVDYKTGAESEAHVEQILVYSLLWREDAESNPGRTSATRLLLRYLGEDLDVPPLTSAQLDGFAVSLTDRTGAARDAIRARPPEARPGVERCSLCPVRQLCPEYWVFLDSATDVAAGEGTDPSESVVSAYGDIEADIGSRRGPRSWDGVAIHSSVVASGSTIVLRTSEDGQVSEGTRVRIIRALLEEEGGGPWIASLTPLSEFFHLRSDHDLEEHLPSRPKL